MATLSPLAPAAFPAISPVAGVRFAATSTGLRYKGRDDITLMELAPGSTLAGVFTKSLTASAPVQWCRAQARHGRVRAIVVNAGNANTFTGRDGAATVKATAMGAAKLLGCKADEVHVASTGVIGVKLPTDKVLATLPALRDGLAGDGWEKSARAIMTTDTFPKGAVAKAKIGGVEVTIAGFCKGSGMIAPDMATMLAFVFTDAKLPAKVLAQLLKRGVAPSFNSITVDSDTSTSDTLLLAASGQANHRKIASADDRALADFRKQLDAVLLDLALQVVRDGEGAEKFVRIDVTGAASPDAARKIGLAIGNSPLVKTALAASDANWGRIVAAIGKAGEKANRDRLTIKIGGVAITRKGEIVPGYDETPVAAHMQGREILIEADVGVGRGKWTVWTCDLTHAYIDINGSYRT